MSFFRKAFYLLIISCVINNFCSAQQHFIQVSGTVVDSMNQLPLDHASVYLSNTTIGTTTSEDGSFTLTNIPPGSYKLVISYLSFKERVIPINEQSNNKVFQIKLHQDITRLNGVVIKAGKLNKSYLAMFRKYFIGTDENSHQCKILNPLVLFFNLDTTKRMFTASAEQPLILVNKALGYKIYYDLQYFHFNFRDNHLIYFGYPRFEPLHARNKRQRRIWKQNRFKTYLGSMRHFMKSLITHQLKKEGFIVNKMVEIKDPYLHKTHDVVYSAPLPYDSMICTAINKPGYMKLKFNNSLYVTYDPPESTGISPKMHVTIFPAVTETEPRYPPSILTMAKSKTCIDRNGALTDPLAVIKHGAWARKQVADLLPLNWKPTSKIKKKTR